jgi:hypothetical protein
MTTKVALQLNAIVGVASTVSAGAMIWLVLTRPTEVASAVANREYGAIALAVAAQLTGWIHAVLHFI